MDPCSVCGAQDVNLVDGFYYCVECGTQDVNVRETILEQTTLGDGIFAHITTKKFTTVVQDGVEMGSEWHKWHTFNFILVGLTDELIALGAKPSVKMKVLWIWSRYVKLYQVKDDSESKNILNIEEVNDLKESNTDDEKEDSGNDDTVPESGRKSRKNKADKILRDIKIITKGILLSILYIALNLDRSDIQLSHLLRFIREGRLSLYKCMKFVPKELNVNEIKNWKSFSLYQNDYNPVTIRELTMTCFKKLNLGVPLVPDLRKVVKNFLKELCLPDDFKDLVFALMHYVPTDFFHIDSISQKSLVRIPDYEGVCMAYIMVALKMCFGLDDDYEVKLSEEIDKINEEENYLKSYKLGRFSNLCDRLFSFKDWCQHLQFRKFMLCKNFLPMSRQFHSQVDDYVFMEHLEKRKKCRIKLSDDVTMDILNKFKLEEESSVIPKTEFVVSLTPMSTYIEVIAQYVQDPDLKLLLSEDFTQYSLRYAIINLRLPSNCYDRESPLVGVSELGKTFNNFIVGTLKQQEADMSLVYVKNCQNKNWLKTKPPKAKHVVKIGENENNTDQQQTSDKESDHGYISNAESTVPESDSTHFTIQDESFQKIEDKILKVVKELDDKKSIFDDNFVDMVIASSDLNHASVKEETEEYVFEINTEPNITMQDSKVNSVYSEDDRMSLIQFNRNAFDKDDMIRELIELARKEYKIPVSKVTTPREPRKRKADVISKEASSSEPKKKRTGKRLKPGEAKVEVDKLVSEYYSYMQNDILNQVSEHVKSLVENVDRSNVLNAPNITNNQNDLNVSNVTENQGEENNSLILNDGETEQSQAEINSETTQVPNTETVDNTVLEENIEDEEEDLFLKSDPNFDEKDHDIRQLYVKVREGLESPNTSICELHNDPEIDRIIQSELKEFSSQHQTTVDKDNIDDTHEFSDPDDDLPLNQLKESNDIEQEKKERKKQKLELLLQDTRNVKEFRYWVRHYQTQRVGKSRDIGKTFDMELHVNLPISFIFVLRECAGIIGCSQFTLYKHIQNIEEILIANSEF